MQQPLIQMHHPGVPTPRHFEPLLPFHAHLKPEYFAALQQQQILAQQQQQQQQQQEQLQAFQAHRQFLAQNRATPVDGTFGDAPDALPRRTFPIRAAQSAGSSGSAHSRVHFAPAASAVARNSWAFPANPARHASRSSLAVENLQEHQLRRKTPSGTIDAGYDGSPAGLASGPPPFKQVVLPASSSVFPTPVVHQDASASAHGLTRYQQQQAAHFGTSGGASIAGSALFQHIESSASSVTATPGPSAVGVATAAVAAAAGAVGASEDVHAVRDQAGLMQTGLLFAQQPQLLQLQLQQQQQQQQHANIAGGLLLQPVFAPSYQPSPGPTAFNPSTYDLRPLWPDSALIQGYQPQPQLQLQPQLQSHLQQQPQPFPFPFPLSNMSGTGTGVTITNASINNSNSSNGNNNNTGIPGSNLGLVPQNATSDSVFLSAAQPMVVFPSQLALQGQDSAFRFLSAASQRAAGAVPQMMESSNMLQTPTQALEMMSMASSSGMPAQQQQQQQQQLRQQGLATSREATAHFNERILAQAERTYADLLLYLTHTKKSLNGRPLPSLRTNTKMSIYSRLAQQQQQQQQLQLQLQLQQQQQQQRQLQMMQHQQTQLQHQLQLQQMGPGFSGMVQQVASDSTPSGQQSAYLQQAMPSAAGMAGLAASAAARAFPLQMHKPSGVAHLPSSDMNALHVPLVTQAKGILDVLSSLCEQSGWKWVDGMLLGGCLHYALEHFEQALVWFKRISALRPDLVEVMSNIAATLLCLDRRDEAIKYWSHAIRAKPSYLESAEHLITVLSADQRHRDAVEIVNFVQSSLRLPKQGSPASATNAATATTATATTAVTASDTGPSTKQEDLANGMATMASAAFATASGSSGSSEKPAQDDNIPRSGSSDTTSTQPGFGSSGYAIPGHDNGRMIGLIHTKANILYALKETSAASEAYEESVLIAVGRTFRNIQDLIVRIRVALLSENGQPGSQSYFSRPSSGPPLLAPEEAKLTARRTFPSTNGQLPGLRYIQDPYHRRTAIATTSNALLSMAKILQDGMASSGYTSQGTTSPSSAVGDILSLYYLSMSLQESPSTANNVGILLASVQQSPAIKPAPLPKQNPKTTQQPQQQMQMQTQQRPHHNLPKNVSETTLAAQLAPAGIAPGSGLALAFKYYSYGLQLDPKHVHLHTNLGSLLKDVGHVDMAIKMYEQAVACDGNFDIALTNLANAVKDRGRIADAIGYYRRAVAANPDFTEAVCGLSTALNSVCDWSGRGGVVLYNGRYDRWHVDDMGMLQDVRQRGCGSGLMKRVVDIVTRQLQEGSVWGVGVLHASAIAMLASQVQDAIGSANIRAATIKGKARESSQVSDSNGDASTSGNHSLDDDDDRLDVAAELQKWAGKPCEGARVLRLIERAARVVMRRWYHDRYIRHAESPGGYARPRLPATLAVPGTPTVLPFHTFTCPLPAKDVRVISQRNALRISYTTLRSPWLSGSVYPPPPPPQPQLNIGYISSDFNNHPLAHLMQSVFGFHNPSRAKAFCYATTASDNSTHRQKIEREAPVFRDVTNWPPDRVIEQILQDGIHILVNLNGYTRGARNDLFAARPAPIQMAFMGFAGTLGAEWCDYLLADTTAVPPSTLRPWRGNVSIGDVFRDEADAGADAENWIYSENIIYCRDSFFCCDHKQSAEANERSLTWQDEQCRRWKMRKELFPHLTDDAVILGNFNQLYKIDPTTFRSWLRILDGVPNAVLWLLRFPELGEQNLRRTATLWAGKSVADRIIFTDVAPKHMHIHRARVCDLFLDTPECNAHTTAADVLWSSTPLLTLPRYEYKMCSRIAASVLKGALPKDEAGQQAAADLIASDESHYEKLAIKLASGLTYRLVHGESGGGSTVYGEGSGRLADLRQLLWEHKWTCGLFDTRRWVSDLEDAYAEAWRKWVNGERGDIYL